MRCLSEFTFQVARRTAPKVPAWVAPTFRVQQAIEAPPRVCGELAGALADLEEGLEALHFALGARLLLGVVLGTLVGLAGFLEAGFERAAVDVVGGDRLFYEHQGAVV